MLSGRKPALPCMEVPVSHISSLFDTEFRQIALIWQVEIICTPKWEAIYRSEKASL